MRARKALRCWLVLCAIVLGGCAGMGGQYSAGSDADSIATAVAVDDVAAVRAMVSRGAITPDQRIRAPGYSAGAPLIVLAARDASLEVLRYLISAGANVNARTPVNETALMLAAYFRDDESAARQHDEAVRILVEAGAQLENTPGQYTALAYAAYNNRQQALRFLLARGARVDGDAQNRSTAVNTPLMMAALQGHQEVVRTLLRAGADPLVRIVRGSTARELAIKYNHTHVEPLLACAEALPPGVRYVQRCENPRVATQP